MVPALVEAAGGSLSCCHHVHAAVQELWQLLLVDPGVLLCLVAEVFGRLCALCIDLDVWRLSSVFLAMFGISTITSWTFTMSCS